MPWHRILGHDELVSRFRRALAQGRLATSFLFVGPPGVGKRTFALKLAQALLCPVQPVEELDPCEVCPACAQVLAGTPVFRTQWACCGAIISSETRAPV